MSTDINSTVLVGRLTRDIEKRVINNKTLISFSIASNRYAGKDKENEVDYFDIQVWGKYAEVLESLLEKGQQVIVYGFLRQQRWEQDGKNRSRIIVNAIVVQIVGSLPQKTMHSESNNGNNTTTPYKPRKEPKQRQNNGPEQFDDDCPF